MKRYKPRSMMPTPTGSDHIERKSTSTETENPLTGKSVSLDRFVKHWPDQATQQAGIPTGADEGLEIVETSQLTLFAEDTPANHLATPGSDKARKMTVISGRKLKGSWLPSGPVGVCLRMLLDTSAWASTKCFLTWKAKATPAGRLLFQLAPSTPRTDEIGSGLWATPRSSSAMATTIRPETARGDEYRGNLEEQVARMMWPTPDATPRGPAGAWTGTRPSGAKESLTLQTAVKMWPTPTATMYKGSSPAAMTRKTGASRENDRLDFAVEKGVGSLNPTWVEWLMGYPSGWTDLKDSETPSSPKSPK